MINPDGSMSGQGTGTVPKIMRVVGETAMTTHDFDVSKAETEVNRLRGQIGVLEGEMNRLQESTGQQQMMDLTQRIQEGEAMVRNNTNNMTMTER